MNCLIVSLLQFVCVFFVWIYANGPKFQVKQADSFILIVARFISSMMMHLQVEQDLQLALTLMKYSVNHHENFTSPYPAFLLAFLHFINNVSVEINVILIFTSIQDVVDTLIKYVSLAVASRVPAFYFQSLVANKMLKVNQKQIKIKKYRT